MKRVLASRMEGAPMHFRTVAVITFVSLGACSGGPEQQVQVVAPVRPRNAMIERFPSECPAEMIQYCQASVKLTPSRR